MILLTFSTALRTPTTKTEFFLIIHIPNKNKNLRENNWSNTENMNSKNRPCKILLIIVIVNQS